MHSAFLEHVRTGAPIDETRFLIFARPIIPLIECGAEFLSRIAAVNRAVFTPVYNRLIAQVVAEAGAVVGSG